MLTPSPQDLRVALARYADARIEDARRSTDATARAVEDAAYTLCVMTGTQAVPQALHTADTMLGARPTGSSALRRATGTRRDDNLQAV
ncbi:DUF5133 domain-containing protein [Streptomyces sp. NPDC053741]|uniref:DUF5133 domain-containing protein n=2 Tax=Streptomyces TaxID=1883 RepID=A0A8D4BDY8_STRFA|nr:MULTISPECIES: DUF5133 domain-containing protein [Streptomyces]MDF9874022.1 hypothetical protein [Streptomyces pratensis]MYT54573.1 DUF5133 domain-containing protein [Streptomyces sp. SID7815]MYT58623.1 DUF5133 domain-containing protein [Streptomyces sp. SID7834]RAS32216.1 uncharacterized protein DUF5133 [Streptomyces avidinii]SNX75972.1 protein of unknown function [Streptomyces microflavus]